MYLKVKTHRIYFCQNTCIYVKFHIFHWLKKTNYKTNSSPQTWPATLLGAGQHYFLSMEMLVLGFHYEKPNSLKTLGPLWNALQKKQKSLFCICQSLGVILAYILGSIFAIVKHNLECYVSSVALTRHVQVSFTFTALIDDAAHVDSIFM